MTCLITGIAGLEDGTIFPNGTFTFTRWPQAVMAQESRVIAPHVVTVTTDSAGGVSFALLPGQYRGIEVATGVAFSFLVPEASTANFQDCLSAATVIPWPDAVQAAIDARDEVLAALSGIPIPVVTTLSTTSPSAIATVATSVSHHATFSVLAFDTVTGFSQSCYIDAIYQAGASDVDWSETAATGPSSGFFATYACVLSGGSIELMATGLSAHPTKYTVIATIFDL